MFEGLRNKKRVDRQFAQLEALHDLINERTNYANRLAENIEILESVIRDLANKYIELEEYDDLSIALAKLKSDITITEIELSEKKTLLATLLTRLGIAEELSNIREERKQLEEMRASFEDYKKMHYNPKDVIICAYTESFSDNILLSAFVFADNVTYNDSETNEELPGKIYRSLNGDRIIGFSNDMMGTLYDEGESDDKYIINTEPEVFITLTDACVCLGSSLYLESSITALQINDLLNEYIGKYKIRKNEDDEFEIVKRRKIKECKNQN